MKLIFKGVVQGVGFRPTIYRIAQKLGLKPTPCTTPLKMSFIKYYH
jgi:hydrogenase maturation factor HypF (carbamoyltransferase family)